jgi:hypothetical protein
MFIGNNCRFAEDKESGVGDEGIFRSSVGVSALLQDDSLKAEVIFVIESMKKRCAGCNYRISFWQIVVNTHDNMLNMFCC